MMHSEDLGKLSGISGVFYSKNDLKLLAKQMIGTNITQESGGPVIGKIISAEVIDNHHLKWEAKINEQYCKHDYTGNPNIVASGGTCVKCGHFEACG